MSDRYIVIGGHVLRTDDWALLKADVGEDRARLLCAGDRKTLEAVILTLRARQAKARAEQQGRSPLAERARELVRGGKGDAA